MHIFIQMSEYLEISYPDGKTTIFFILKRFSNNPPPPQKFSMTPDLLKKVIFFLLLSQFCIFLIQMSDCLDFSYPYVKTW